jgi:hypothetical protein
MSRARVSSDATGATEQRRFLSGRRGITHRAAMSLLPASWAAGVSYRYVGGARTRAFSPPFSLKSSWWEGEREPKCRSPSFLPQAAGGEP